MPDRHQQAFVGRHWIADPVSGAHFEREHLRREQELLKRFIRRFVVVGRQPLRILALAADRGR
jgi:hypothetical protein